MPHADLWEFVSKLGSWQSRPGPTYRKLAEAIREEVSSGNLPLGASIPAERKLAEALSVSRTTVVGAYEALRADGWIESVQGSGTRISRSDLPPTGTSRRDPDSNRRHTAFRGLIESNPSTISFLGLHLPAISPEFEDAFRETARDLKSLLRHHGYTGLGLPALHEAIASHISDSGLPTKAEEILVTHGAQQAIGLAASVLLRPGDAVALEDPTYLGAIDVFASAGARLIPIPVGEEGVRPDRLSEALARENPRLVYLMPTFQNPVGTVLSPDARREVARIADQHGTTILEDGTLEDLSFGRRPPPPLAAFSRSGRVISVGSLSKLIWGGLRVGWLRAPEALLAPLANLKVMGDLGNSAISQAVAVRLLRRARGIRERRREQIQERFDLLAAELSAQLPGWVWKRPLGGLSLWVHLPHGDAEDFAPLALRHGVAILPGSTCSPTGRFSEYLRLPFCLEPQQIRDGVRRLARAWRAYEPAPKASRAGLHVVV
ncbi:MAG: PLP-dependent aminotransferase family protein [Thermoanaerobaculia bacterium]